jgi:D-lyxose ketol-isomerase
MKRSVINRAYRDALACFQRHQWHLPPNPQWDITDFGLGDFDRYGLTLINLATEPEYCEKLMYARGGQVTPQHHHAQKKEDIICRNGTLVLELWPANGTSAKEAHEVRVPINGVLTVVSTGQPLRLQQGSRITLTPGIQHTFYPGSDECIIGEVSTANDDAHDNFFADPGVGRFPGIEEDEPAQIKILPDLSP